MDSTFSRFIVRFAMLTAITLVVLASVSAGDRRAVRADAKAPAERVVPAAPAD